MYLEFENINFIIIIVFTLYQVQLGHFQRENPHNPWYCYSRDRNVVVVGLVIAYVTKTGE
jgi:hypothetical protein